MSCELSSVRKDSNPSPGEAVVSDLRFRSGTGVGHDAGRDFPERLITHRSSEINCILSWSSVRMRDNALDSETDTPEVHCSCLRPRWVFHIGEVRAWTVSTDVPLPPLKSAGFHGKLAFVFLGYFFVQLQARKENPNKGV